MHSILRRAKRRNQEYSNQKKFIIMNTLTNDMTRLCGEIAALRDGRATLMSSLVETKEAMQGEVSQMLTGFGEARADMAKQTKAELGEFVSQLKETVAALLGAVQNDLAGAHQAWHGASPAFRKTPMAAEEPSYKSVPKAKKKKR